MQISSNFKSEEFLSKGFHIYILNAGYNPLWWIDRDLVNFCEWLKAKCDNTSVVINDWYWGGKYEYSGFRSPRDIGAENSQHKSKSAIDIKVKGYTPKQIYQIVLDNFDFINSEFGISTIEKVKYTPTWIHIDKRWTGLNYLLEVKP